MIYHIVCGDEAANLVTQATAMEADAQGAVVVMKDILNVGPLVPAEGESFSAMRTAFWHGVAPHAQSNIAVGDTEVLQDLLSTIYQQPNAELWIWTSILPADVCMHHWIWQHANNCHEQIKVIPIGGLPFFGADGRLFFPERIVDILPAQLAKATKLARKQLPQEIAQYKEEWEALCKENMGMRVSQSNKTAISKPINHFDTQIAAYCTPELKKANKVVNTILHKTKLPLGDWVIAWRLRCMAAEGILHLEGTPEAGLTAWEICLAGDSLFALREGE